MTPETLTLYTADDFKNALVVLDKRIGESKNLRKMSPIRMISAGGFVAVSCFGNRNATEDVDYILDPEIEHLKKAEEKLAAAIDDVTSRLKLAKHWINDSMWVFAIGEPRRRLFRESIEQDEKLFEGRYLTIYAAKWQWSLNRKLIRLSGAPPRDRDKSDAVELMRCMIKVTGEMLDRNVVMNWPTNNVDIIKDVILDEVAAMYLTKYGTSPLAQSLGAILPRSGYR